MFPVLTKITTKGSIATSALDFSRVRANENRKAPNTTKRQRERVINSWEITSGINDETPIAYT
ncbi:hypothetical protein D3C81_1720510 [compost metagenome]